MDLPAHLRHVAAVSQPAPPHVCRMSSGTASMTPPNATGPFASLVHPSRHMDTYGMPPQRSRTPEPFEASASPTFFAGQQLSQIGQISQLEQLGQLSQLSQLSQIGQQALLQHCSIPSLPDNNAQLLNPAAAMPCFGSQNAGHVGGHSQLSQLTRQLSQQAMLVGTVAALSEESGQLRHQWKSDVSRLEKELAELRCAAAWALPRLGQAGQPNQLQSLVVQGGDSSPRNSNRHTSVPGGGYSPRGPQRQPELTAYSVQTSPEKDASPQRLGNSPRGDQGRLSESCMQMHNAYGAGWGQADQILRETPQFLPAASSRCAPHESAQVTGMMQIMSERERFASCVRAATMGSAASVAPSSPDCAGRISEALPAAPDRSNVGHSPKCPTRHLSDVVMQMHNDMHNASAAVPQEWPVREVPRLPEISIESMNSQNKQSQPAGQLEEMMRELERMEAALQKSQKEVAVLKEEKKVSETAHARDVTALESMLETVLSENARLNKMAEQPQADDARSVRSMSEPATEP